MSEVFNFDFDKLQKQGISKEATLNFLKTKTENNFNFDELENTFKSNGYTQEQITNAMYHSLQEASKSGDLWLRPLPKDDLVSGNHSADFVDSATTADNTQNNTTSSGLRSTQSNLTQNHSMILQSENPQADTQDSKILQDSQATQETTSSGSIVEIESGLYEPSARSLLNINDEAQSEVIADYSPQDNADSKGFFEGILEGIGYETDNVKAINAEADRLLRESVKQGKDLKDLSGAEKRRLYELYNDNKGLFEFNSMEASLQKEYNRLKEKQNIAQIKDPKDLTQEQREIIAQDLGAIQNTWNYFFVDEKDTLKEWQDNYKAQSEILPQTQKAIAFLDNIHKHKSISNIIESAYKGEMNKEAFEDYLNEVEAIATTAGFDEIGYNKKGELYFYKGENAYKVNQGFFDNFTNILSANAGSISGGISGAIAGAKLGKTPQTAMAGAILGGGAGAFLGGGADVLITNAYLNRENNLDELIRHATEEGAMSIVGDVAIAGIVKYGGKALNKAKDMPLGKMIDYTPILGFAKRAVDGNASSAQKLIDKTYTQEQMLSLKEAGESFGANLSFNGEKGKNPFKSTFGEDSSFAKSYDFLQNALSLPTQRARQQEFIQAIRADESGQLLAFLSEASAQSPKAYDNMRSILNATSFQVKKQLDNLNLNKGDIKAVFDELESGTKQSYDEAINKIIGGIYNDSYKVNLNELKSQSKEIGKPIQQELPTKSNLEKDLTQQEIKEVIGKWDLSPETNSKGKQRLMVSKVSKEEAEELNRHFNFKGKRDLTREIDSHQIIHTLKQHGDENIEKSRGQIAVNMDDISNYMDIVKNNDFKNIQDNGKIVYAKQINGYHIVLEEVLEGQDKIRFFDMWKQKGQLNKEVLLSHSQRPNTSPSLNLERPMPSNTIADSTTNKVFNQGDIKFDIDSYANTDEFKAFNQIKNAEKAKDIIPQPNKQTFQAYKQSLESQGIPIENEVKSFINFVEKNIYNENGVSFNQLNNALKTLNSYYKEAKDPNFKNHIKNAMDSFLREDIKAGIEAIFSQNKSAYKDISSLYATALSDYADMKEVLKIADKLKIRNATTEQNKALDSLLKLAKGQGDKLDNISSLTKALDKDNRALIELNMLSGLFQKSLYDENALQVIDSGKFFKELQALHKDTFQSKEAQDFINIMSDFDRLFKNDILIAKALKPTTTGQIGSSIATSIEGAVKFQMVKNAFSHLVRLMPHIPFMSGLNQKVQGAALRYHLQKALESSFSVSELKHTLQNRIAKAPYTSQTKSQIEKILNRVDTIQDELIEVAKEANVFYTQREETKLVLNAIVGKDIVNQNDGRIAQVSRKNIAKMTSDKAIAKSVANGFSPQEHFKAVQDIENLYQGAVFRETQKDTKNNDPALIIHRYEAELDNANGLITIKESLDKNKNRIYSIELEGLESKLSTKTHENKQSTLDSSVKDFDTSVDSNMSLNAKGIIPQMPKDNPQLVALQTKIQQSRQQIAESKNPDKEYLYQVFKPDEIIELEKQYFNQAMPQEYKEIIQDFPRLYEQSLANELKTYAKDTDTIQEVTTQLLNDFKDKPFKNTAKHAELLLFNTLRDKAQELGFKELDINTPSFKVAFGKFQAKLKKGDIQDLSEHIATISLRKNRLRIEQSLNIKPLAEFGTNYAEHYHSGESAIAKLLNEKQGQVSGAFYRKELGDIDLVWGDSNFGLKHILDKHGSEFENIAKELDEIIQNGEVVKRKGRDEAYNIEYKGFKVGINKGFNKQGENKWVVTAFNDNIEKTAKTAPANDSTKGASLPLNSNTIIPQQTLESTMKKFNYDERKAKDLLEWHKDSSPLTKDENGVPKVFYHGSETDKPFEVFLSEKDQTKWGFWFSSNADDADLYARARGNQAGKHGYEVFLKAKNIFDFNDEKNLEVLKKIFSKEDYEFMLDDLQKWGKEINVFNMLRDTNFDRYRSKAEVFKNELKKLGYDGIKELGDTIVVFDSNQIKHIDNKGVDGKFFNESSPNIYQSNAHLGSGLVGGSVAGIESDENGNIVGFNPAKFAAGFLGGVMSSKSIERLAKNPKAKAVMERIYLKKDIMPKMQQGKKWIHKKL